MLILVLILLTGSLAHWLALNQLNQLGRTSQLGVAGGQELLASTAAGLPEVLRTESSGQLANIWGRRQSNQAAWVAKVGEV